MASSRLDQFISDPRVKKALSTKPGEEGFSLIELVVVIAVLAILSAVALPNFLGVQKDGQVATAKNTLATMVKECVTSGLRGTGTSFASVQSTKGKLNGYTMSALAATGATNTCYQGIAAGSNDLPDYVISYDSTTGVTSKTCSVISTDYLAGCYGSTDLSATIASNVTTGYW